MNSVIVNTPVKEILEIIDLLNQKDDTKNLSQKKQITSAVTVPPLNIKRNYRLGNSKITIAFGNPELERSVHPLFAHLEITHSDSIKNKLELFSDSKYLYFKYRSKLIDVFKIKDMEYFSGAVKQQIFSIIYNRKYDEWMMSLHASGIVQNKKAILFSAAGGSGKSTLVALLKAHGFDYVSDDFIMGDKEGMVYPLPSAISVKAGAAQTLSEYYPGLKESEPMEAFSGKSVQYIPVNNTEEIKAAPYPVKALIFVEYNITGHFSFKETDKKEALRLLLKETWVNPDRENVMLFFEWMEKTTFYKLSYTRFSDALAVINKLYQ